MTEKDIKTNWYYFCSLAKQLDQTRQYVDHTLDSKGAYVNGKTFSNEFAKILMLAASEFEVVSKSLCKESGEKIAWNANIGSITAGILRNYPNIGMTQITTPYQIIQPLKNLKIIKKSNTNGKLNDKVYGIPWWGDHNSLKHSRSDRYSLATLENCIYSMASLYVIEIYLCKKVLGKTDAIRGIECDYFGDEYGYSRLVTESGNNLPDF